MKQILIFFIAIGISACSSNSKQGDNSTKAKPEKQIRLIRIETPQNGSLFAIGDKIGINLKLIDSNVVPDSIVLSVDNKRITTIQELSTTLETGNQQLGGLSIKATAWSNGKHQTASVGVFIKSNITPKNLSYKVLKTFSHDPLAYTQGLFFHNGYLYEGTGQNGQSSLRKIEITTGKVLQSLNLSQELFGEGIALLNNKIYQLTWTSGIGFVYDLETFVKTGSFTYSTQGWGLTTNGNELIMSDGSNTIYFIEPNNFSEVRRISVMDNNGAVNMLNELEYIDGSIYANIYLTNNIVVIDPKTGAVTATINFDNILKKSDRNGREDVFNGIAIDPETNHIFVTGKYWGKLFQIEIH